MTIPTLLLGLLVQSISLDSLNHSGTNGSINFTSSPIYFDSGFSTGSPSLFSIKERGTNVVSVARDGKVTLATKPDEAAAVFWNAVQQLGHQSSVLQSNREEVLEVLKGCHDYLNPDPSFTHAVYIPPAARLRIAADAIEKREALMKRLDALIEKLK